MRLSCLGVKLDIGPEAISRCISEAGLGFMFAQQHHSAMRHVGPTRVELGTRTIFNLLGPLSNPAGVTRQLARRLRAAMACVRSPKCCAISARKASGSCMARASTRSRTTGMTQVAALENGAIRTFELTPDDFGLADRACSPTIKGGDGAHNAAALKGVLERRMRTPTATSRLPMPPLRW